MGAWDRADDVGAEPAAGGLCDAQTAIGEESAQARVELAALGVGNGGLT
jgi:hypothetical protein